MQSSTCPVIQYLDQVINESSQLHLAWSSTTETMLLVTEKWKYLKVTHDLTVKNMFQFFTSNTGQWYWMIVARWHSISFLYIGVTWALSQSPGNIPVKSVFWYIFWRIDAALEAHSFRIPAGTLSGLAALWACKFPNNFWTPLTVTVLEYQACPMGYFYPSLGY